MDSAPSFTIIPPCSPEMASHEENMQAGNRDTRQKEVHLTVLLAWGNEKVVFAKLQHRRHSRGRCSGSSAFPHDDDGCMCGVQKRI